MTAREGGSLTIAMTGNPKDSPWYVTPQEARVRKHVSLTLSDEARDRLKRMAKARKTSSSAVVEELVMGTPIRPTTGKEGS